MKRISDNIIIMGLIVLVVYMLYCKKKEKFITGKECVNRCINYGKSEEKCNSICLIKPKQNSKKNKSKKSISKTFKERVEHYKKIIKNIDIMPDYELLYQFIGIIINLKDIIIITKNNKISDNHKKYLDYINKIYIKYSYIIDNEFPLLVYLYLKKEIKLIKKYFKNINLCFLYLNIGKHNSNYDSIDKKYITSLNNYKKKLQKNYKLLESEINVEF